MTLKRQVFATASRILLSALKLNKATKISCLLAEQIEPLYRREINGRQCVFYCPNELVFWRVQTHFTKEPETIEWIQTFREGEVLFDVGANIGLYSIYAALRGVDVVAFEPESQNYALLNKNIFINQLSEQVMCFNLALSSHDSIEYLYIPKFEWGGALNNFGVPLNWQHKEFTPIFKQGVIGFSLDSFLDFYPSKFPMHLKIDVDGLENAILFGAKRTIEDSRLKSVLIEINESLPEDLEMIHIIENAGLSLQRKSHSEMFEDTEFKDVYNYLFLRK